MVHVENRNPRRENVLRLAKRLDPEPRHSQQVTRLALRLFDQTGELHQLDSDSRELLEYACLLHDIGWSGGDTKHKRRSYDMIKAASLDGFSDAEKEIIASVARYHGVKPPREHHPWNQALSPEDKRKVRYLSAIIRAADALDRTHRDAVEDIECSTEKNTIVLKLKTSHHPNQELCALGRKKQYFEEIFERKLRVL
jgi:exopolyphosphatase/guanosine-5'-triphosphate,3'-diphosphate pyrophosphatase